MGWRWLFLSLLVAGGGLLFCYLTRPRIDEEHCPYKVGTDRTECGGRPCEAEPPCRQL